MALFSSICSSFSSFNLYQNASSSPFPRSPVILKNPVTKPPKISVSTSPHSVRPVTCNSNDPSSNGSSRIFIKGLPLSTTEGFLAKTFSRFGTVTKAKIITERSSKQSLGFAYVWFDCEEAAQLAVEDMDGKIGTFPIGPEFTPNMRELWLHDPFGDYIVYLEFLSRTFLS